MNAQYFTILAVVIALAVVILVAIFKDRDITIDVGNEGPKRKRHLKISIKKPRGQPGQAPKAPPEEEPQCVNGSRG